MIETNKILVIIDMQNDFCIEEKYKASKVIPLIKKRLEYYRKNNYQVIYTKDISIDPIKQISEGFVPMCIENTWGCEIIDELKPLSQDIIIKKYKFIFDNWEQFSEIFENSIIEIVGIYTEFCVYGNTFEISKFCRNVNVISNECIGLREDMTADALKYMKIFANVI